MGYSRECSWNIVLRMILPSYHLDLFSPPSWPSLDKSLALDGAHIQLQLINLFLFLGNNHILSIYETLG